MRIIYLLKAFTMGYALRISKKYLAWYIQQQRKKRASAVPSVVERYFLEFDSLLSQYVGLDGTITLDADFDVTLKAMQKVAATQIILGNTTNTDFIAFRNTGEIRVSIDSVVIDSALGLIKYGKLHSVRVARAGSQVTVWLDDTIVASGSITTPFNADFIGRFGAGFYWDGIIANLKITDAGTLVGDFPLDESGENDVIVNRAAVLGSELVVNGTNITDTTGWAEPRGASTLSAANGRIRSQADGTGTHGMVTTLTGLSVGEQHTIDVEVNRGTNTGTLFIRYSDNAGLFSGILETISNPDDGSYSFVVTATAETMYVGGISSGHAAGEYFELGNVSAKQIPAATPYGTRFNKATLNPKFTEVSDGWEGVELVTNGGFDTDTDWTKNAGVSISGGVMQFSSSAAGFLAFQDLGDYIAGNVYRFRFNYDVDVNIQPLISGKSGPSVSGTGSYSELITPTATGVRTQFNASNTIIGQIDNASAKRFLEVA